MKTIEQLKKAIEKHLDELAEEGLYVRSVDIDSERYERPRNAVSSYDRDTYLRVVNVHLTTEKPDYAKNRA